MVSEEALKQAVSEIRKKTTVKIWAADKGFNYQTVVKVLNNCTGKRQIGITQDIIEALKKDGYLVRGEA